MELSQRIATYTPTKYNPYYWWRRFKSSKSPLHKYQPLESKIKNGDYEISDYHWWLMWERKLEQEAIGDIKDVALVHELRGLHSERIRRLTVDFERDEAQILEAMYKDFWIEFRMEKEEVEEEMLQFDGTLFEFYQHIYSKNKQIKNGN
jgi:hypothetical protein